MSTLIEELQALDGSSPLIELYTLDCTPLGGAVVHFTNTESTAGTSISFGGVAYTPIPLQTAGWEFTSTGNQPSPTITISNVSRQLLSYTVTLGDLVGARLTKIVTVGRFLDDGDTPDSSQFLGPEVYVIDQKTAHTNQFITWQLVGVLNQVNQYLPRRQVLRKDFPGVSRERAR
jgi:lambda family phage minor tail protein L